ncbi:Synaptobrevin [Fasciola gigantica]|uniref:Synaptobrevin n=1 Tax=Fasciola gigantica TaxID=46835 RepID=A0A504YVS7_FASGI|nr:Synaptobrevin [Fasciola gigantica]
MDAAHGPQDYRGDDRIRREQAKVQEVVGIMRENVSRVLERETRLAEIDTRAGRVTSKSRQFEAVSTRVRRNFWQNMKMWGILAMVGDE